MSIVRGYNHKDGRIVAHFKNDAEHQAYIDAAVKKGAEQRGMYLKWPDGRVEWVDFDEAQEMHRTPWQQLHTDLAKARAAHEDNGGVLLCEGGGFRLCRCLEETSRGLFSCACRPAGYVERLAPSFDESQPENINRRPVAASDQGDLFGAAQC